MLVESRSKKEHHLDEVYKKRNYDLKLKQEIDFLKREERLENVQRIARAQQFAKDQIMKKIEEDNIKGQNNKESKEYALKTRLDVKRHA